MSVIPCKRDPELTKKIDEFAEILKTRAHELESFGHNDPSKFYETGILDGAIQKIRGQISASMAEKRTFVAAVLSLMQDRGFISDWHDAGGQNRHDYTVILNDGRNSVIELKGCLDGNNSNISERPPHAHEFLIWSVCQNKGADPRHNVWSGIHSRFSADIIESQKLIDGLIVWDWLCGSEARPCPKLTFGFEGATTIGPYELPPPCLYVFPGLIPAPRNNPSPAPQAIENVGLLDAMKRCFGVADEEVSYVRFLAEMKGAEIVRTTEVTRAGVVQQLSKPTPIRRK